MNTKQTIKSVRSHVSNEQGSIYNLTKRNGALPLLHGLAGGVVFLGGLVLLITLMNSLTPLQAKISVYQQAALIGLVAYGLYRATNVFVRFGTKTAPFKPGVKYHVGELPEGLHIVDEAGNVVG